MRASHIYLSDAQNLPEFDHKSCVPESVPSDLRDSCMDHDHAVQSLPQHFHRKPPVIYQGFACQFHKLKLWGFGGYYKVRESHHFIDNALITSKHIRNLTSKR